VPPATTCASSPLTGSSRTPRSTARGNRDLSTWLGNRHAWPEAWNRTWDLSSATLNLTPELTRELVEKLHAVIDTFRDRAAPEGTDEAAQVRIHTHTFPLTTE
jgi:hypothetical protein